MNLKITNNAGVADAKQSTPRHAQRKLSALIVLPFCLLAAQSVLAGGPVHTKKMTNYYTPPRQLPGEKAPAPNPNTAFRPGSISGMIWWDTTKVQRNLGSVRPSFGFGGPVSNGCLGLSVSASMQSQPVGVVRYLGFSQVGSMAECAYEIDQVPVGVNLIVVNRVQQNIFKTTVATFETSPQFRIPGGQCNAYLASNTMLGGGIRVCGDKAGQVNLEVTAISSIPQPR